ncbi:hypothetical protein EDD11_001677 [Mortierella claussenii]|nr:hypothetical protein EDD11_001677 [Mortierella claussenii]
MDRHSSVSVPRLVTPPLALPTPIQTPTRCSSSTTGKAVGSPPRAHLLSPSNDKNQKKQQQQQHELNDAHTESARQHRTLQVDGSSSSVADISTEEKFNSHTTSSSAELSKSTIRDLVALDATKAWVPRSSTGLQLLQESSLQTPTIPSSEALPQYVQSPLRFDSLLADHSSALPTATTLSRSLDLSFGLAGIGTGSSNTNSAASDNDSYTSGQQQSQPLLQQQSPPQPYHAFHMSSGDAGLSHSPGSSQSSGLEQPLGVSSFIWHSRASSQGDCHPSLSVAATLSSLSPAIRQDSMPGDSNQFFSMSAALRADPFVPAAQNRITRSLSLSEPMGFNTGFGGAHSSTGSSKHGGYGQDEVDALATYRMSLPTMEEESEDALEQPRAARTRSYSTSATFGPGIYRSISSSSFDIADRQNPFSTSAFTKDSLGLLNTQDQHPFLQRKLSGGSTWPTISHQSVDQGRSIIPSNHRRSITSNSYASPIWEIPAVSAHLLPTQPNLERARVEQQRVPRRFSLAPSSGFQPYDHFLEAEHLGTSQAMSGYSNRTPADSNYIHPQRRHSVAGPSGSYFRSSSSAYDLTASLDALQLNESEPSTSWGISEDADHDEYDQGHASGATELGKGVTLSQLSHHGSLYVVEFKAGRNDLFYVADGNSMALKRGDLVMVEADRGKDLGKITNDSISPQQIQKLQKENAEAAAMAAQQDGQRAPKEIHPKRIFRPALPSEISQLVHKNQDEIKAMMVCQTKVRQKKLPMEVVDAEYQWYDEMLLTNLDRRKLTFYFHAEHRIDFRELVRDLFKIYKTRIWMYAVSPSMTSAGAGREMGVQSTPPNILTSLSTSPSSPQPQHSAPNLHPQSSPPMLSSTQAMLQQQQLRQPHQQREQQHHQQYQQQLEGRYHQYQPQHQPHLQELMRQMQAQYFSAPLLPLSPAQQQHGGATYQGIQQDHHWMQAESTSHQRAFYEPSYPLQPPHPLM